MNSGRRCFVSLAASALSLLFAATADSGQAKPAATTPTTGAAVRARYYPPVKGVADVGYFMKQKPKKVGNELVTVFAVKNLSTTHSIVLLRIEETWYNRKTEVAGNHIERYKKPLQPGEIVEIEVRTPWDANYHSANHTFMHAHGKCVTKRVATLEELTKAS